MVLRLVTEEVTWTNDGNVSPEMQGWRRTMLAALVSTLGQVLPFLHAVLESHFGQAARAAQAGKEQEARAQAATVSAAIGGLCQWLLHTRHACRSAPQDPAAWSHHALGRHMLL